MPVYCFTCPQCGTEMESEGTVMSPPRYKRCKCGATARRDLRREQASMPPEYRVDRWRGHVSNAMAVPPKQAKAFQKAMKPHGVTVNDKGQVVCESPGARKRAMRVLGYTDLE